MLSVMAVCGMCNRLRAMSSAIRLAEFTGRPMECVWDPQPNCNIHYTDQFDTKIDIMRSSDWWRKMVIRSNGGLKIASVGEVFVGSKQTSRVIKGALSLGDEQLTMIEAGNWFYHRDDNIFHNFERQRELLRRHTLKPALTSFLDVRYKSIADGQKVVGVHVRGTDNSHCKEHSPLPVVIKAVDRIMEDYGKIILATDSQEAVDQFTGRYGSRVMVATKPPVDRGTVEGMRSGVRDLYLLALCDAVVGSCGSTFSHMAMALAKTNALMIPHAPMARDTVPTCCTYGFYDLDWFRSVVRTT